MSYFMAVQLPRLPLARVLLNIIFDIALLTSGQLLDSVGRLQSVDRGKPFAEDQKLRTFLEQRMQVFFFIARTFAATSPSRIKDKTLLC